MDVREPIKERHLAEGTLAILCLIATFLLAAMKKLSIEAELIIDVIIAALALSVALTKAYFTHIARILFERERLTGAKTAKMAAILEELGGRDFAHASRVADLTLEKLERIKHGFLSLDADSYFKLLIDEMDSAKKGARVLAVSSISTLRWTEDPRQKNYLKANFEARKRGVEIRRVFLLSPSEMNGEVGARIKRIISEQKANNFKIGVA
jgi:hypothetical protein